MSFTDRDSAAFQAGGEAHGLTKREYMAAQLFPEMCRQANEEHKNWGDAARWTVQAVDALVEELNK